MKALTKLCVPFLVWKNNKIMDQNKQAQMGPLWSYLVQSLKSSLQASCCNLSAHGAIMASSTSGTWSSDCTAKKKRKKKKRRSPGKHSDSTLTVNSERKARWTRFKTAQEDDCSQHSGEFRLVSDTDRSGESEAHRGRVIRKNREKLKPARDCRNEGWIFVFMYCAVSL